MTKKLPQKTTFAQRFNSIEDCLLQIHENDERLQPRNVGITTQEM